MKGEKRKNGTGSPGLVKSTKIGYVAGIGDEDSHLWTKWGIVRYFKSRYGSGKEVLGEAAGLYVSS